jgi:hypothetical protein
MAYDSRGLRRCDECGRPTLKPTRVHQGCDYCATCYKRVFVIASCAQCGQSARVHRHSAQPATCSSCIRASRRCLRCDKPLPRAALMVPGGAVCGPCSHHFLEPRPCATCGTPSTRLSKAAGRDASELVCERCRRRLTHATCSHCGRHRAVEARTADGQPRCVQCLPGGEASHSCSGCGSMVSGRGNARCRPCQVKSQVSALLGVFREGMQYGWSRSIVDRFRDWYLASGTLAPHAVSRLPQYELFFQRLEASLGEAGHVDSARLLQTFRSDELARFKVPVRFLRVAYGVELDHEARSEVADRARVVDILAGCRQEGWFSVLEQFVAWLEGKRVSSRTLRLYLSAASDLCRTLRISGSRAPARAAIRDYLGTHRGQRANLSRFITFGNSQLGWDIILSQPSVKATTMLDPTVESLRELLERLERTGHMDVEALEEAIALLLGYESVDFSKVRWVIGRRSGRPSSMIYEGVAVKLPRFVSVLSKRWAEATQASNANL